MPGSEHNLRQCHETLKIFTAQGLSRFEPVVIEGMPFLIGLFFKEKEAKSPFLVNKTISETIETKLN